MPLDSRCSLLVLFALVTLPKHGLASPGDQDVLSTGGSNASSASTMRFLLQDPTGEPEGPSTEPETFEYSEVVNEEVCRTRALPDGSERQECSVVPENRRFECSAERKESASESDGRLGTPIRTDSLQACCNVCVAVPNSACRSWWRTRGSDQLCYNNENR